MKFESLTDHNHMVNKYDSVDWLRSTIVNYRQIPRSYQETQLAFVWWMVAPQFVAEFVVVTALISSLKLSGPVASIYGKAWESAMEEV